MKKYNLSQIMTRAWQIIRETGTDLSTALRLAWYEAKTGVKKAYTFQMNESRRAMIEAYTAQLTCSIIEGNADIHEIHKGNIIRAALQAPIKNEIIILDGKSVGLLKYALRQAA